MGNNINTIEVKSKPVGGSDTISLIETSLRDIGIKDAKAFSTQLYTFDGKIDSNKLPEISELVHHSLTQNALINNPVEAKDWDIAVRVDFKPGVTDNAARVLKKDLGLLGIKNCDVYTSNIHYIKGGYNSNLKEMLERVSSNPQIHDIKILTKEEFEKNNGFEKKVHPVKLSKRDNYFEIDLANMSEEELINTGKKGTLNLQIVKPDMDQSDIDKLRGGTLSLAEDYMKAIRKYSISEKNKVSNRKVKRLTDVELEVLAQMWSEHCRHSLYNASFPDGKKGIFTELIKKPTEKVLKEKPWLGVSIYKDNSGVFKFDDNWNILIKNETHNSPSALDPFGGSITGIVGVNRDPAGTGIGGEVIGNFLFYFLGHPDDKRKYYKTKTEEGNSFTLEDLLLNPKPIYDGVVDGVEKGGNQMGIPLNLGICQFHDRYNGKPQIGVGSIGRMPRKINGKPSHEKHIDVGDLLYLCGGRAGIDGIHGATFSSEELSANSPATAVQIGDPYTQRKLFEALLEARDKGYINFITDLGAGGTSCAALEMAEETGGIEIDLDKLLVKYPGMTATELLLNESQERMALAIDPKNAKKVEDIMRKHEVEFSNIGTFTDTGRARVYHKKETVVDMDLDFINHGYPKRELHPEEYRLSKSDKTILQNTLNSSLIITQQRFNREGKNFHREMFYEMLKRPNLRSVAPIVDRMDSTVKGLQVQHCIQGSGRISTATSCTLVDVESSDGLIQSYGHTERQSYIDSKLMGKNSFLRSIGRSIAMGGRLDWMVATDQALWQSSDDGKYQQMLIEANQGMAEVIEGLKIPVISGKDSMYNQATTYDEKGKVTKRGVFPTLLMNTVAKVNDVSKIVTIDAKHHEDIVYIVGSPTQNDLGGSEFLNMVSEKDCIEYNIGKVSNKNLSYVFDTFEKIEDAINSGLLQSSNYIGAGGLATAIKETALAGEKGMEIGLEGVTTLEKLSSPDIMYSETEGRFLVTVSEEQKERFESLMKHKCQYIGRVVTDPIRHRGGNIHITHRGETIIDEPIKKLLEIYHETEVKE